MLKCESKIQCVFKSQLGCELLYQATSWESYLNHCPLCSGLRKESRMSSSGEGLVTMYRRA